MSNRFPQEAVLRDGRRLVLRPFQQGDTQALYDFFLRLPAERRRFAWDRIDDRELRALAQGVTVDGIAYGPIQAQIDRMQGDNLWLTVSLREGKNREVRRVLDDDGLYRFSLAN